MIDGEEVTMKIGTQLESLWTKVKNVREERIKDLEESLIIEKAVLELAKGIIAIEEGK